MTDIVQDQNGGVTRHMHSIVLLNGEAEVYPLDSIGIPCALAFPGYYEDCLAGKDKSVSS